MDTTRDILYRAFLLNDSNIRASIEAGAGIGKGIDGCVVDSADFSDVDIVQFRSKKSLQDGMDAGDVFLGARRLRMAGTLYGSTRALLYDAYWDLRRVLNPVLAQRESPADKGYLPLYFSMPTNRTVDYVTGAIDMRVLAMPFSHQMVWQRDQQGGDDSNALAIPWQATFLLKDPSLMSDVPKDYTFSTTTNVTGVTATAATDLINKTSHGLVAGDSIVFDAKTNGAGLTIGTQYWVIASGLTTNAFKVSTVAGGSAVDITTDGTSMSYVKTVSSSGNLVNRGTYLAPLNALWVVGPQAGTITVQLGGAVNFVITVPASTGNRTIRYKGFDKIITFEEASIETLRMGSIPLTMVHPNIPDGTSAYTVTFTGVTVQNGSHMWFWEEYA